jgi:hypothetical protein
MNFAPLVKALLAEKNLEEKFAKNQKIHIFGSHSKKFNGRKLHLNSSS